MRPAFTLAVYVHLLPDDLPDPAFLDEVAPRFELATESVEVEFVAEER